MIIAITGASGFVGSHVTRHLRARGDEVRTISLRHAIDVVLLQDCDAVIHFAGEPVAQRWTAEARKKISASRVEGTRALVAALQNLSRPPRTLISASAVGYYGSRGDEILTETSPPSHDFLGDVAAAWEREAMEATGLGLRVACMRIGVVLGNGGGALRRMLPPFKLGIGGRLGSGKQWMSWIHVDDLCALILFALDHNGLYGPVNAVSPNPVTNEQFTRELARELHRPAMFPVPPIALKLMFGEMAQILLGGQRVIPDAALHAGFAFQYPELSGALREILG